MRLARSAAALAVFLLAAACADQSPTASPRDGGASRIVNGTYAGNSYPNVGALLVDFDGNHVLNGNDEDCTGSLISPTVFLTAAHCVEFLPANAQLYVSFSPDLYASKIGVIAATGFRFDPLYGHDTANEHDLAVVFLPASATKGITPLKLPPAGYLDALGAQNGLKDVVFVNVGYGVSASRTGVPSFGYDGRRNVSKSPFMSLRPYWLVLKMNTAATGEGGDCYGDSGGPKFMDGNTSMIFATVTSGDTNCRSTTVDYRLDTDSARGFLGQFVALP
ncbi:MAG TPA: trypsin-like serine protease [Longimicrobiaceae bacterium]|jgi:hypothetical protein|nr:trypsin-like serine protease [Longimicrobiaceae bacterium]